MLTHPETEVDSRESKNPYQFSIISITYENSLYISLLNLKKECNLSMICVACAHHAGAKQIVGKLGHKTCEEPAPQTAKNFLSTKKV